MNLYPMYEVKNIESGDISTSVDLREKYPKFVLSPVTDPAALHALKAYAEVCEPELAQDILQWIQRMEEDKGNRRLGKVGVLNSVHMGIEIFETSNHDMKLQW